MPLFIKTPLNPTVVADSGSYPRALNVLSRKETSVQKMLNWHGLAGYEPPTQATLLTIMQGAPQGAVFFDVGAHIGIYSALISTIYKAKAPRVIAFEPTPRTAYVARKLAEANGIEYELTESAVSAEPGTATLYLSDRGETSNSLNESFREHAETVDVPVTTLDAYSKEKGVDPYLVKIDVETLEGDVLAGSLEMIERARPWIVCEVLRYSQGCAIDAPLARLAELGYELRPLLPDNPWPITHPRELSAYPGWHCDWIFAPKPIDEPFMAAVDAWESAIAECTPETNDLVPAGTKPEPGWNAPYGAKAAAAGAGRPGLLARLRGRG